MTGCSGEWALESSSGSREEEGGGRALGKPGGHHGARVRKSVASDTPGDRKPPAEHGDFSDAPTARQSHTRQVEQEGHHRVRVLPAHTHPARGLCESCASCDADFENVVVFTGDDQDLRARARVEGLARGQCSEPGHGQALVLAAGSRVHTAPALDTAAVQLVIHVLVHRQAVIFYPAICKANSK